MPAYFGARVHRRIEHERLALAEHHQTGLERFDANLRPLQVAHDADMPTDLRGNLAHRCHTCGLIRRRTVREVDAEHVCPGKNQLLENGRVIGCWPESRDDLGAPASIFATVVGRESRT
jgi:hypothetical protein